jgi:hypothetical protein
MTQKTKLIVGGVLVAVVGYYFYNKNKTKNEVADLKDGADVPAPATIQPMTSVPLEVTEIKADSITLAQGGNKFSNFAGSRGNSMSAQYFR